MQYPIGIVIDLPNFEFEFEFGNLLSLAIVIKHTNVTIELSAKATKP
jgi:hypothetical protein